MVSLKNKKQSGFTIVELLIVIVIIGILAGLVITQIMGANQQARDTERKTDLNNISSQLETYYARTGGFPTITDLNTETWRNKNNISTGDNNKSFTDPRGDAATLNGEVAVNKYAYVPAPSGCASPTDSDGKNTDVTNPCKTFTLTAVLENKNDQQKDVSSTDAQTVYIKKSASKE